MRHHQKPCGEVMPQSHWMLGQAEGALPLAAQEGQETPSPAGGGPHLLAAQQAAPPPLQLPPPQPGHPRVWLGLKAWQAGAPICP